MDEKIISQRVAQSVVAARGQQVRRKDKDLMQDTGGVSKGRDREPHKKPPREDSKTRYKQKDVIPDEQDHDTHRDKDEPVGRKTKRQGTEVHPLDRTNESAWAGLNIPEENYHRDVYSSLWHILEDNTGTSEKDFAGQDEIRDACEGIVRSPSVGRVIQRFAGKGCRPSYCAECIFDRLRDCDE